MLIYPSRFFHIKKTTFLTLSHFPEFNTYQFIRFPVNHTLVVDNLKKKSLHVSIPLSFRLNLN